jgi:beta-barrel assembly-enhancing protease
LNKAKKECVVLLVVLLFLSFPAFWISPIVGTLPSHWAGASSGGFSAKTLSIVSNPAFDETFRTIGIRLAEQWPERIPYYRIFLVRYLDQLAAIDEQGTIYIGANALATMDSQEEAAGLLAHELGHLTRRHLFQRRLSVLCSLISAEFLLGDSRLSKKFFYLKTYSFCRSEEMEADRIAADMLDKAHLPIQGLVRVFERDGRNPVHKDVLEIISDHPSDARRVAALNVLKQQSAVSQARPLEVPWIKLQQSIPQGTER